MKKLDIKSLFIVTKDLMVNFNDLFDEEIDKKIILKLKEFKTIMNDNDYINNHNFRFLSKRLSNFFYAKDFFSIQNFYIDNVSLLTLDTNEKNEFIKQNDTLERFKWFNSWYNHSRIDLNKDVVSGSIIKYIRKSLNCGSNIRKHYDSDHIPYIDDIIEYLYSDIMDEYPLIKSILIFKQLLLLNQILTIDVICTLFMLVLRKYSLDMNGIFNFYLSFLFDESKKGSIEANIDFFNKMNIVDFTNNFKNAFYQSIDLSIYIANNVSQHLKDIQSLKNEELDILYGKEIKEMLSTRITIDFPIFYLHRIYMKRPIYYKKLSELMNKQLIQIVNSEYSINYFNAPLLKTINKIDAEKNDRVIRLRNKY